MFVVLFVCVLVPLINAKSLPLPDYIKACSESDPNFSKCAIDSANAAIPIFAKGDKKYGSVSLIPLVLPELDIKTNSLQLSFKNMEINGLDKMKLIDMQVDFKTNKGKIVAVMDEIIFKGPYTINGQLLVLPIQGEGDADIRFYNGEYTLTFDLEHFEKEGEDFIRLINTAATFKLKKATYNFGNLFNGDKRLGDELNKTLNENWEAVTQDLREGIEKPMAEIITSISNNYCEKIPYNQIFKS